MEIKVDDMFIHHGISDVMTKIYELSDYEDGFLTYQTNYGEEYTDFYEIISSGMYDKDYTDRFINKLNKLKLEDIDLVEE